MAFTQLGGREIEDRFHRESKALASELAELEAIQRDRMRDAERRRVVGPYRGEGTGGGDTSWIGEDGRPGDRESSVVDAAGNVFSIFTGTGVATFTGVPPRTIPVARAKAFPYFGETVRILGGNLHGLLGVSAFPGERILVADGHFHLLDASRAKGKPEGR